MIADNSETCIIGCIVGKPPCLFKEVEMTVAAPIANPYRYRNVAQPDIMQATALKAALQRSFEDHKAGRVHSWREVKRNLGLG